MRATGLPFTSVSILFAWLSVVCIANDADSVAVDPESGLHKDVEESWILVKNHCSSCHSGRLLAQQQLDRENWLKSIRRMQSEEQLWDLGEAEPKILDYLSTFYGTSENKVKQRPRRAQLRQEKITPESKSSVESSLEESESSPDKPNLDQQSETREPEQPVEPAP